MVDFKFYAVVKDMRAVLNYVERRNRMHADYRYQPNQVSNIHDEDDPLGKKYGPYLTRETPPPDAGKIKSRWI